MRQNHRGEYPPDWDEIKDRLDELLALEPMAVVGVGPVGVQA